MKKISGYILVKETSAGVPNLVVAAYDFDKPPNFDGKIAIPTQVRELGRRIGSVLTDQEGRFVLSSEDLEFQGNESRPDLVLIVFAPEDILKLDQPYPLPPEKRILYVSAIPRTEAGAEEAYIIRLLQAQLDKFHISTTSLAKSIATVSTGFINAIESSWSFQDDLREKLRPRLQKEQTKSDDFRKVAREKVKNLSAIPLHLRDTNGTNAFRNNQFLISDRKDLASKLKPLQETAITDGLKRLGTTRPTLRLRLTTEDLADLGLSGPGGKIDSQKLAAKVRSLMQGVDFVRLRGLNNPPPEELETKYLS